MECAQLSRPGATSSILSCPLPPIAMKHLSHSATPPPTHTQPHRHFRKLHLASTAQNRTRQIQVEGWWEWVGVSNILVSFPEARVLAQPRGRQQGHGEDRLQGLSSGSFGTLLVNCGRKHLERPRQWLFGSWDWPVRLGRPG